MGLGISWISVFSVRTETAECGNQCATAARRRNGGDAGTWGGGSIGDFLETPVPGGYGGLKSYRRTLWNRSMCRAVGNQDPSGTARNRRMQRPIRSPFWNHVLWALAYDWSQFLEMMFSVSRLDVLGGSFGVLGGSSRDFHVFFNETWYFSNILVTKKENILT